MAESERLTWLVEWVRKHGPTDCLNAAFVWDYIEATNTPYKFQMIGAPRCKGLGIDLGTLYRNLELTRVAVGIGGGLSGQGFPKWVWSYRAV